MRGCAEADTYMFLKLFVGILNRYNFVVDEQNGIVRLIDFENARDYSDVESKEEIESLKD